MSDITRTDSQSLIKLAVKLTAVEAPALQAALKQEIAAGSRTIVFDLRATTTLDSTGIGLLIATSNTLATMQGAIRLQNVAPDILKLLQHMRLADRLHATATATGEANRG
jgi:anti-anti-sigma factor